MQHDFWRQADQIYPHSNHSSTEWPWAGELIFPIHKNWCEDEIDLYLGELKCHHLLASSGLPLLIGPKASVSVESPSLMLYKKCLTTPTSYMNACVSIVCCCLVTSCVQFFATPWTTSMPDFPAPHHLPEFAKVHIHCISDAIQSSHSLLPFSHSIIPSISVFSNESALCLR